MVSPVSSTNKTNRHNIIEILLKMTLSAMTNQSTNQQKLQGLI
jgi:hypothetical protein